MLPTIVSTQWLDEHLGTPELMIADIRWVNGPAEAAFNLYKAGRIPGAIFLDLDQELSDRSDLTRGRHPLPDPQKFVQMLARFGIGKGVQIIAYDDTAGSIAARLWWMMQWIGMPVCSVLDGGINKWIAEGRPLEKGDAVPVPRPAEPVVPVLHPEMILRKSEIQTAVSNGMILMDARAPERYRGDVEPIDRLAGHIPGAVNAPFSNNLTTDATPVFRTPAQLREHYQSLGVSDGHEAICSCGSGVTACHDLLAMSIAGFKDMKLYPGSWSEWIADLP